MSIDDATLAKARAAWDTCLQQEREAQEAQQRLTAARKEIAAFHRRMAAAWEKPLRRSPRTGGLDGTAHRRCRAC